ncbi:MAG: hypothetical protein ACLSAP_06220 [Oscillospiraceae bacterium]
MKPLDNLAHRFQSSRKPRRWQPTRLARTAPFSLLAAPRRPAGDDPLELQARDQIIMPRNVHISAINALIGNAVPVYVNRASTAAGIRSA